MLPDTDGSYTVDTDACETQAGYSLLPQQTDGPDLQIGYWPNKLNDSEKKIEKLVTTEKKCPAVVWTVLLLRPYFGVSWSSAITDHGAL